MIKDEILAGGPILRGKWAAIACFWWSGWWWSRSSVLFDFLNNKRFDPFDLIHVSGAIIFLAIGWVFLDQYGRNCWFTWVPDDQPWYNKVQKKEIYRADVRRESWTSTRSLNKSQ